MIFSATLGVQEENHGGGGRIGPKPDYQNTDILLHRLGWAEIFPVLLKK